jgi:hypothetical protein
MCDIGECSIGNIQTLAFGVLTVDQHVSVDDDNVNMYSYIP